MDDEHARELEWTRRQLDELAADNLRLTGRAGNFQRELEVRRRGFTLLSKLGRALGADVELKPALAAALPVMEAGLQVQRTLAVERDGDAYVPFAWTGYRGEEVQAIARARIPLPPERLEPGLVVTRETPPEDWLPAVQEALRVPYFVAAPVESTGIALIAGREAQVSGFFLKLDRADLDAVSVAGELVASAVRNTHAAALGEIRRFLPPAVADELLSGRMAVDQGYERRDVTLLAADMVGFTRLADSIEPDVLAGLLNRYLREMTTLAHAYGGTVGSLAGDGVIVIFGAPHACPPEEHAWAAAQAAFAMRARLDVVTGGDDVAVAIRIGVATGSCAVGVFGSAAQATYTAIGSPVNLAARLESAAAPGGVLVSGRTRGLLGDRVNAVPRGELSLKGFSEPVPTFMIEPAAAPAGS